MFKVGDILYANETYNTYLGQLVKNEKYKLDKIVIQPSNEITYKISGGCFDGDVFNTSIFYKKNEIRKMKCLK